MWVGTGAVSGNRSSDMDGNRGSSEGENMPTLSVCQKLMPRIVKHLYL